MKTKQTLAYHFDTPLKEGLILKRNSQFTMDLLLDGDLVKAHCPTTGRLGDIEARNIACLVSESTDPKRKLKYTVEAISCDAIEAGEKNWIGINQILSNRLVEHFIATNQLSAMLPSSQSIQREVNLGQSKLDFLVDQTYLEVKTPLTTLHVTYGSHIKTKKITPFSSTDRFTKHIRELADSLEQHERAILLTVRQYAPTDIKPNQHSTNYQEVKETMAYAISKGLETWELDCQFSPEGVHLLRYRNMTDTTLDY